jgi:CDP-2,3-bis-(O-geranylgeranyl)-sn-glycerol synthase
VTIDTFIDMLLLLLAANGAPVMGQFLFGSHGARPVDNGRTLRDGQPLFGASKTWRGLVLAAAACSAASALLGHGVGFGLSFSALSMAGDLLSSFIKRRKGLASGARSTALDQLPEALLPSGFAVIVMGLDWWWALLLSLAFMLGHMAISLPLYWLHIRKTPY